MNTSESTQPRAFAATEMVACPACSRANPPTRSNCLYCGAELGIAETTSSVATAPHHEQESENLLHVVAVMALNDGHAHAGADVGELLSLSTLEFKALLSRRVAPLLSTTMAARAQSTSEKLNAAGLGTIIVSDQQLNLETTPKEISALQVVDDSLIASVRRNGENVSVRSEDVALIVLGRFYSTTTEVEQKGNKSKQVIAERHLTSDEAVLDFYSWDDEIGCRIRAGSFDFSCLGAEKKVTAFENFGALTDLLRRKAENAVFDDSYVQLRGALNKIWPPEPRASTTERRRTLTRAINATATKRDNELQFTRYSRLLRFSYRQEFHDNARQA